VTLVLAEIRGRASLLPLKKSMFRFSKQASF
jgi:hypothetical protein